eukprot:TRINITY_DN8176_c0_g2_i3.p1 TRINITY_DN8176_c0_g2~~TRINITY_DN8176_c0_g2_i3.p1  ORF type:complete len:201 (+),score=-9.83 TRINITY_DN8176_c0_g2_i3:73-603(+)
MASVHQNVYCMSYNGVKVFGYPSQIMQCVYKNYYEYSYFLFFSLFLVTKAYVITICMLKCVLHTLQECNSSWVSWLYQLEQLKYYVSISIRGCTFFLAIYFELYVCMQQFLSLWICLFSSQKSITFIIVAEPVIQNCLLLQQFTLIYLKSQNKYVILKLLQKGTNQRNGKMYLYQT